MKYRALKDYLEFVQINGRLFVAITVALVALVALQFHTTSYKKECLGVVDLKETTIAFDSPVVVKNIFVIPGQRVKKGQALLEVKPIETTLKILELKTFLDQLVSENDIQNSLFFNKKEKKVPSPTEIQIAGLKRQLQELQQTMSQYIRFAENDGIVGSVNFRVNEQVTPFEPIITLNSTEPNLVYGFLHENRLSDFRLGEAIFVQSLNNKAKSTNGVVISLGNRITQFPERLTGGPDKIYWGREIVVSLPNSNTFLPGEKVQLVSSDQPAGLHFDFVKARAIPSSEESPKIVAYNLPMEASGLAFLPNTNESQIIVVSDDLNKSNKSPFWTVQLTENSDQNHSPIQTSSPLGKKEDLESISTDGTNFYALGSMNSKNDGRLVVFRIENEKALILNTIPFKEKLLHGLISIPTLQPLKEKLLNELEIEGFSIQSGKAILSLKRPIFEDGSSILVEIQNFSTFISAPEISNLEIQIVSPLVFQSKQCLGKSHISDLTFVHDGILLLTICNSSRRSQLWHFNSNQNSSFPKLLKSFDLVNLEGVLVGSDNSTIYLSDDNGNKGTSTIFKTTIPASR